MSSNKCSTSISKCDNSDTCSSKCKRIIKSALDEKHFKSTICIKVKLRHVISQINTQKISGKLLPFNNFDVQYEGGSIKFQQEVRLKSIVRELFIYLKHKQEL